MENHVWGENKLFVKYLPTLLNDILEKIFYYFFKVFEEFSFLPTNFLIFFFLLFLLQEQIAAMLYNMSLNKKCHSHLANGNTINFITYIYQTEFYRTYESRGENESKKRCIKTILHTLIRLVQDSVLGMELLEQQKHMPSALFFRLNASNATPDMHQQQLPLDESHSRDISLLARQLLLAEQQKTGSSAADTNGSAVQMESIRKHKLQLQRQESYV